MRDNHEIWVLIYLNYINFVGLIVCCCMFLVQWSSHPIGKWNLVSTKLNHGSFNVI